MKINQQLLVYEVIEKISNNLYRLSIKKITLIGQKSKKPSNNYSKDKARRMNELSECVKLIKNLCCPMDFDL